MITLAGAVFVASLLGSLHCAGMCGGFLAFAVGLDAPDMTHAQRLRLQGAYHLGRLCTYTLLGAASGALGSVVDLGGGAVGLQHAAAMLAGAVMIVFGLATLLKVWGVRVPATGLGRMLAPAVRRGHRLAAPLPPLGRAATVGLFTTLLPCGWLYAFAVTAAGTADPWWGALTMAVFWSGTLPVMVSLGAGIQSLAGRAGRLAPASMALLMTVVGAVTVVQRAALPGPGAPAVPTTMDESVERILSVDHADLPCCAPEEAPGPEGGAHGG